MQHQPQLHSVDQPSVPGAGAPGIEAFLDAVRSRFALLDGAIGDWQPGWIGPDEAEAGAVEALYLATSRAHPEAGPAYWVTRSWGMLVWQPAVLAILAAHMAERALAVDKLSQRLDGTLVAGFRLPGEGAFVAGADPVEESGRRLRALAERLLFRLSRFGRIKRLNAERLLADRLLGVVAQLPEALPFADSAAVIATGRQWLEATDLVDRSSLVACSMDDGTERAVLSRKTCCLHYLIEPDRLCASCPKQNRALREKRMRAPEGADA